MRGGVAHNAFLAGAAAGLELGLDQRDKRRLLCRERQRALQQQGQRNEARVADDEAWQLGEMRGFEPARVELLVRRHARVLRDARMELPGADVDRDDMARAALEQRVGEAARRGAEIEAIAILNVDAEMREREDELHAAARDERMWAFRDDFGFLRDFLRGLRDRDSIGANESRFDRRAGLGATFEEAALSEQRVRARHLTPPAAAESRFRAPCRANGRRPAKPARNRGCRAPKPLA